MDIVAPDFKYMQVDGVSVTYTVTDRITAQYFVDGEDFYFTFPLPEAVRTNTAFIERIIQGSIAKEIRQLRPPRVLRIYWQDEDVLRQKTGMNARETLKAAGVTIIKTEAVGIADCSMFLVSHIPDGLPSYFVEVDYKMP